MSSWRHATLPSRCRMMNLIIKSTSSLKTKNFACSPMLGKVVELTYWMRMDHGEIVTSHLMIFPIPVFCRLTDYWTLPLERYIRSSALDSFTSLAELPIKVSHCLCTLAMSEFVEILPLLIFNHSLLLNMREANRTLPSVNFDLLSPTRRSLFLLHF